MGYLKGLKRQLIYAGRHLIKEPNVNNDEEQIAILNAYSNYVLANAKDIKFSEEGKIELTF